MTPRRFHWTLRSRGPALDTWPAAERDEALALLRHDHAARSALADALADATEDAVPATRSERDALARMRHAVRIAVAPPAPVIRGLGWGAMAACMAAGLYLGTIDTDLASAGPEAAVPATVLAALDP